MDRSGAEPPVGTESFQHVFSTLNNNLRDALKYSGDFSAWLYEHSHFEKSEQDLKEMFRTWLDEQSRKYFESMTVPPRAWKLFDDICENGGNISPSDYEDYGFNSPQNMRGSVAKLEQADLVISELDETDHRRKTISVQAKGWLVQHYRSTGRT